MGRLTRDPEVRYSTGADGSNAIARYTLAVDRRRSRSDANEQTADFIGCVAFGRSAEFAEKYLHQGTKVVVTGRIQTGSYTNKDGQKVYTTDIVVEEIDLDMLPDDYLNGIIKLCKEELNRRLTKEGINYGQCSFYELFIRSWSSFWTSNKKMEPKNERVYFYI